MAAAAVSQCAPGWLPGDPFSGISGTGVNGGGLCAAAWDPDGAGPLSARLVIGGDFSVAGSCLASNIVSWDPATDTWSALGAVNGFVRAVLPLPNGDLIAAGSFTTAGGVAASRIARFSQGSWFPLGSGCNSSVYALARTTNGEVVAGGGFSTAGGVQSPGLARWDGTNWLAAGSGVIGGVSSLAATAAGEVVAVGSFAYAGGLLANNVAVFGPGGWSTLGSGLQYSVGGVAVTPNGDIFIASNATVQHSVYRWNGTAWVGLGVVAGSGNGVSKLAALPNGDLLALGQFTLAGGVSAHSIARWDGVSWSGFGTGLRWTPFDPGYAEGVAVMPGGDLVATGSFTFAGGLRTQNVARWSSNAWHALGKGFHGSIADAVRLPDGSWIFVGSFVRHDAAVVENVARWDGTSWTGLASGLVGSASSIELLPNGDVVIAGYFSAIGAVGANNVARWNGSTWSALGSGTNGGVTSLALLPNGDLVVGGEFTSAGGAPASRVARWNGQAWSPLGSGCNNTVYEVLAEPSGDVVVGGWFTSAGGVAANRVARWDGVAFAPLGAGVNGVVTMLARAPGGQLVVGGTFSQAGGVAASGIARWDGTAWSGYGTGSLAPVAAVEWLPNGDLIAGVELLLAPSIFFSGMARWTGTSWTPFGGNLGARPGFLRRVGDTVFVGGGVMITGSQVATGWARLVTPCPAVSSPFGIACASSGGANTLATVEEAWIGGVTRIRSTGIPALAIIAFVSGLATTSLPLAAVFPQGQPGCDLLVMPDLLDVALATTGAAEALIPFPASASLIGQSFHHQHVPLELDASGAIVAITATNALTLTIGSW